MSQRYLKRAGSESKKCTKLLRSCIIVCFFSRIAILDDFWGMRLVLLHTVH